MPALGDIDRHSGCHRCSIVTVSHHRESPVVYENPQESLLDDGCPMAHASICTTIPNRSASLWPRGPANTAIRSTFSSPASRSRTPTSNATTERCATTGWANICSIPSRCAGVRHLLALGLQSRTAEHGPGRHPPKTEASPGGLTFYFWPLQKTVLSGPAPVRQPRGACARYNRHLVNARQVLRHAAPIVGAEIARCVRSGSRLICYI